MTTSVRQTSFASGEIAPVLRGRSDVAQYASALRTCKNFFISRHGAAVSRPGMQYLGSTKSDGKVRLIPFVTADDTAYVLEFGALYVRVWKNGSLVQSGGSPVEIATLYAAADLARLQYAQVGDVLTLTHPDYAPRELIRSSETSWSLAALDFDLPAQLGGPAPAGVPYIYGRDPAPVVGTDGVEREWQWQVTTLGRWPDGRTFESMPRTIRHVRNPSTSALDAITDGQKYVITEEWPVELQFQLAGVWGGDWEPIGTRVYRGRNGAFGFVGEVKGHPGVAEFARFVDEGIDPDHLDQPPKGTHPFEVMNVDGSTVLRTEDPAAVAFYESRMIFGGTEERPGWLWCSRSNSYLDFDLPVPAPAKAALEPFELASRRREEIRALVGLDRLLVFTQSSVWAVGGSGGANLSAADLVDARVQQEIGCSHVPPLVVDGSALYVRSKGRGVRDLFYDDARRGYGGGDLTLLAEHLFAAPITAWTYAEDPWSIVWAVRSDGKLLSLTYARDQQVWAWAQHETDGAVESVCSIPEGSEDAVYLVVRRTIGGSAKRYVERLCSRVVAANTICLDSYAKQLLLVSGSATDFTGLDHLEGRDVYAVVDGNVQGPFKVSSGKITVTTDPTKLAAEASAGLRYTCDLDLLEIPQQKQRVKRVSQVLWDVVESRGGYVGPNFDHLTEWRQRDVADSYDAIGLFTGVAYGRVTSGYDHTGRAVLRQVDPLPCMVIGVTREIDIGG